MDRKIIRKVPASRVPFAVLSLLICGVLLAICILFWQAWKKESVLTGKEIASSGTQVENFTDKAPAED